MNIDNKKNDWSDFEVFNHVGIRNRDPFITINSQSAFILSSGFLFCAKNEIDKMTHVCLSFSKSNNAICFKFIDNKNELGALNINKGIISGNSFFNWANIDKDKIKGKYKATLENIHGHGKFWTIFLKD